MGISFDYRKLRGRIVEMYGNIVAFYDKLCITPTQASKKMNNKAGFSQEDIVEWCGLLDIDLKDVGLYFYVLNV